MKGKTTCLSSQFPSPNEVDLALLFRRSVSASFSAPSTPVASATRLSASGEQHTLSLHREQRSGELELTQFMGAAVYFPPSMRAAGPGAPLVGAKRGRASDGAGAGAVTPRKIQAAAAEDPDAAYEPPVTRAAAARRASGGSGRSAAAGGRGKGKGRARKVVVEPQEDADEMEVEDGGARKKVKTELGGENDDGVGFLIPGFAGMEVVSNMDAASEAGRDKTPAASSVAGTSASGAMFPGSPRSVEGDY